MAALTPLAPEGFYRVEATFHCCDKECRRFEEHMLVQLGYNGSAEPILFVPELLDKGLGIPTRGFRIDDDRLGRITPLKVAVNRSEAGTVH